MATSALMMVAMASGATAQLGINDGTTANQDSHLLYLPRALENTGGNEVEPTYKLWVAGFTIALTFSILNSIGINLQKYSLRHEAILTAKRSSFRQPIWVLGFILICFGSLMDFVAFGMAPQTLLAPLAALSLVWNLLIAPIFHDETITRENLAATGIIFGGVTITVIFAGHSTPNYSLDDLLQMYQKPVMYIYIGCVVLFLWVMFETKSRIERTGLGENGMYHVVCYGGIAGTLGGQSVLLAKSTVELIKTEIWWDHDNYAAFQQYQTYLIIGGMITCLISQIVILNGGLERFDALLMIPVYQSFWILSSVLGGILYFEEYHNMTWLQLSMFTIGGAVTLYGIFSLLSSQRPIESDQSVNESMSATGFCCGLGGGGGGIAVKNANNCEHRDHHEVI